MSAVNDEVSPVYLVCSNFKLLNYVDLFNMFNLFENFSILNVNFVFNFLNVKFYWIIGLILNGF